MRFGSTRVFSPFLDGDAVHDDGVGHFDLLFHSGGASYVGPLYGGLVGHLAQRSDDAVRSHLRAAEGERTHTLHTHKRTSRI